MTQVSALLPPRCMEAMPALAFTSRARPPGSTRQDCGPSATANTRSMTERVAELLILRPDMPRSLHASMNEVVSNLHLVGSDSETLRHAGKLRAELQYGRIDEILATGLHAFLTQFLDRVNDIGSRISRDFLMPEVA